MSPQADPIRRLAEERGHLMGELGVHPGDEGWARAEAAAIASLTTREVRLRLPARLARLLERLSRVAGSRAR